MLRETVTVQTRAGRTYFGPKCAAFMGILPSKVTVKASARPAARQAVHDERQTDWLEVMA